MQRDSSIQDTILDKLQAERKPVTVVIINGFQIKGRISAMLWSWTRTASSRSSTSTRSLPLCRGSRFRCKKTPCQAL